MIQLIRKSDETLMIRTIFGTESCYQVVFRVFYFYFLRLDVCSCSSGTLKLYNQNSETAPYSYQRFISVVFEDTMNLSICTDPL